jgi:ABC-type multidrug transport system ATPase subunit
MFTSKVLAVHLQAVGYRYPQTDKVALSEISYTFPKGTTAIVGPNGAGKSTLVKLLTGLLAPTSGSISVQLPDGTCLPPEQVDKAVLFQEPSHLYLTIRQNVTMRFERATGEDARIHNALEIAGLRGAVEKLPEGIDTLVGAGFGGRVDLSGGQWQRLALARLIYQDAPVMILDEPVASLDPDGERAVFELFAEMTQAKVIIFTTHRYDSIPRGTKIVVLVDGRIVETGTHEELLQRQRHYWSLYITGGPTTRQLTGTGDRLAGTGGEDHTAPDSGGEDKVLTDLRTIVRDGIPRKRAVYDRPLRPTARLSASGRRSADRQLGETRSQCAAHDLEDILVDRVDGRASQPCEVKERTGRDSNGRSDTPHTLVVDGVEEGLCGDAWHSPEREHDSGGRVAAHHPGAR